MVSDPKYKTNVVEWHGHERNAGSLYALLRICSSTHARGFSSRATTARTQIAATPRRRSKEGGRVVVILVETGFLHDTEEFFFVDFTVTITIGFIDHFLKLFVSHVLAEFLRDALEVAE
jgi:hypothetical protein